jgi:hypothetical protein
MRFATILAAITLLAISAGVAYCFAAALGHTAAMRALESSSESMSEPSEEVALAQALTAALNAADVDAWLELFY